LQFETIYTRLLKGDLIYCTTNLLILVPFFYNIITVEYVIPSESNLYWKVDDLHYSL